MESFAVIDTETTWSNEAMSIGVVIADAESFKIMDKKYLIIDPAYKESGMFSYALMLSKIKPLTCSRDEAIREVNWLLDSWRVSHLYAYNASFDKRCLPELREYQWYDIMKVAAYAQYNDKIPDDAECCCTGRLKRGYGVEPMMRMLSGKKHYLEKHNAIEDARDELYIMRLLGRPLSGYSHALI